MYKIVALGAAALLAATLAGCASEPADQPTEGGGAPAEQTQTAPEPKENKVSLVDSGWSVDEQGYIHYGVIIKNEGAQGALFPTVKIVSKDESGNVISSDEQVLMSIRPDQELAWGGQAGHGTPPATVEFEVSVGSSNWQDSDPNIEMFRIDGLNVQDSGYGMVHFVGEITSLLEDTNMNQVAVSALLRDANGAIVGGYTGFADNLSAGGTTAFDIIGYGVPDYATVEAWAQPWSVAK